LRASHHDRDDHRADDADRAHPRDPGIRRLLLTGS
jgi:hypothetical protein